MKLLVLGSSAGGGFPQWNCNCRNCRGLREGSIRTRARTQSSVAVSNDSSNWVLINASPDILTQIGSIEQFTPNDGIRNSPIKAVILVDSQIDHTTGLLMLREGDRLPIYCTENVREDLIAGNPILRVLESYCGTDWNRIPIESSDGFTISGFDGLHFHAMAVDGKAPPYSPHRDAHLPGDNIALTITNQASGRSIFYAPGLARVDDRVAQWMSRADCILVDGTFWSEDEMTRQGAGRKSASEMGHLPQSGSDGMLTHLSRFQASRKILIHINNTNPLLDEDSAERRQVERMGIEVAFDGMEIEIR
ncbi:MAG: pyrroloquinoline quinone biosynthesis protein PqqB [Candidatus Binataceae bacterium]|nr:pyrroloquinoline quinone biosynthesis protein PqqB [Candidatus Binataceae bacterium]